MLAGAGLTQLKLAKKRRKLVITPVYNNHSDLESYSYSLGRLNV